MPRYHFNVYDGVEMLDAAGVELPDLSFARREAIRYAGALLEDAAKKDSLGREWRMEVTDAIGLIMFRLDFVVTDAPAVNSFSRSAGHARPCRLEPFRMTATQRRRHALPPPMGPNFADLSTTASVNLSRHARLRGHPRLGCDLGVKPYDFRKS